jgi:hypothetical protein
MVAFKLSFIKRAELFSYQIQDVVYDLNKDKLQFKLVDYFADHPEIKVTVKYFAIGAASKYGIATSDTDNIEFRMTANAEKHIESIVKDISCEIRDGLRKEIENAKGRKESKKLLDNLPM